MACVHTNTDSLLVFHKLDDSRQVFKPVSEIRALPGCRLYHSRHTGGVGQRHVDRLGYALEAVILIHKVEV